ncbi:MAG: MFS transporter [Asgard group archaeon]|nr:MFS transporter [Asgard group archaeon]
MLDEILVIRESIPIFYYNRDPKAAYDDDHYVLQSGFFVALSAFANEMSDDRLRYIVLENKLYALDEVSDILIIFGDREKMTQEVVNKLQNDIAKAAKYLNTLVEKYVAGRFVPSQEMLNNLAEEFGEYLKQEDLVEDDSPFDPYKSRSMMQKFIFSSIGYKPGQCNIGPAERMKRLLIGMMGFVVAIIGAILFMIYMTNPLYMLMLAIPIFMGFFGLFQYVFKFCAVNGLTKKYDMR